MPLCTRLPARLQKKRIAPRVRGSMEQGTKLGFAVLALCASVACSGGEVADDVVVSGSPPAARTTTSYAPATAPTPPPQDARYVTRVVDLSAARGSNQQAPFIRLGACLVDFNGDSTLDVVGISSDFMTAQAVVLDGRNGAVLWRSANNYVYGAMAFCPSTNTFIVNDKESFDVSLHSVRDPSAPKVVRLDDAPMRYGFGKSCLAVQTKSSKVQGVSLADGASVPCAGAKLENITALIYDHEQAFDLKLKGKVWRSELSATKYMLRVREPGTPVLTASAAGELNWSAELAFQAPYPMAVLTDDLLVVAGAPVSSQDRTVYLVALDRKTGKQRYQQPLCGRGGAVMSLRRNGSTMLVQEGWSGLWALDIQSGRVLWQAGKCT